MKQADFNYNSKIVLNSFEKATAAQLISYKICKKENETTDQINARLIKTMNSDKLKLEVISLVLRWNSKRKKLGLKPWK